MTFIDMDQRQGSSGGYVQPVHTRVTQSWFRWPPGVANPPGRGAVSGAAGLLLVAMLMAAIGALSTESQPTAVVLTVNDAIGPATADYITRGITRAHEGGARIVVVQLDTPGGLDTSMRDIIRHILASPIPVVIYVAPSGARAASAGTYMLYAAHVAAMAPGTNLGAATPVQIGGLPDIGPRSPARDKKADDAEPEGGEAKDDAAADEPGAADANDTDGEAADPGAAAPAAQDAMAKKMVNDAVAYIRSLAELRGRNAEWAEQAVREAASLSAEQALAAGVVDVMAENLGDLFVQLDGRSVRLGGRELSLDLAGVLPQSLEPDWRTRLLAVITNPNIAYILMLLGIYGLFFELSNPGFLLPGVTGAICLLLALYSLQVLPVNYAGLGLLLLGIGFMVAELFMPSFGALGIGGLIAFVIGSIILFDADSPSYQVSLSVVAAVAILTAAFFFIAVRVVVRAHQGPVVSGREELIGSEGTVLQDFDGSGRVRVHSEIWTARSAMPLRKGDRIRVTAMEGLVLEVDKVN